MRGVKPLTEDEKDWLVHGGLKPETMVRAEATGTEAYFATRGALIAPLGPRPADPDDHRVRVGRIIDRYSTGFLVRYGRIYSE